MLSFSRSPTAPVVSPVPANGTVSRNPSVKFLELNGSETSLFLTFKHAFFRQFVTEFKLEASTLTGHDAVPRLEPVEVQRSC